MSHTEEVKRILSGMKPKDLIEIFQYFYTHSGITLLEEMDDTSARNVILSFADKDIYRIFGKMENKNCARILKSMKQEDCMKHFTKINIRRQPKILNLIFDKSEQEISTTSKKEVVKELPKCESSQKELPKKESPKDESKEDKTKNISKEIVKETRKRDTSTTSTIREFSVQKDEDYIPLLRETNNKAIKLINSVVQPQKKQRIERDIIPVCIPCKFDDIGYCKKNKDLFHPRKECHFYNTFRGCNNNKCRFIHRNY